MVTFPPWKNYHPAYASIYIYKRASQKTLFRTKCSFDFIYTIYERCLYMGGRWRGGRRRSVSIYGRLFKSHFLYARHTHTQHTHKSALDIRIFCVCAESLVWQKRMFPPKNYQFTMQLFKFAYYSLRVLMCVENYTYSTLKTKNLITLEN